MAAALASGAKLTEPGLDEQVFHEPREPKWQEAWDITDRLVLAAREETKQNGARFVLAVLSTPGSVYPDPQMRADTAAPDQRNRGSELRERHGCLDRVDRRQEQPPVRQPAQAAGQLALQDRGELAKKARYRARLVGFVATAGG